MGVKGDLVRREGGRRTGWLNIWFRKLYDDRIGGGSCFVKFSGSGLFASMSLILNEDFLVGSFSWVSCNISVKTCTVIWKEEYNMSTIDSLVYLDWTLAAVTNWKFSSSRILCCSHVIVVWYNEMFGSDLEKGSIGTSPPPLKKCMFSIHICIYS